MKGLRCAFQGRLGAAAEIRESKNGRPFLTCKVVVETQEAYNGAEPVVEWVSCRLFGPKDTSKTDLEALAGKLGKGSEVYIEGNLSARPWLRDGAPQAGLECFCWVLQPLGQIGRRPSSDPRPTSTSTSRPRREREPRPTGAVGPSNPVHDDDIMDRF